MDETWIKLSISYPAPDDENVEMYFFEQDLYALLYSFGAATINEQDASTLDGKSLPAGTKRLLCYFEQSQAVQAAEVKAQVEQKARNAGVKLETALESFDDQSWKDGWKAFFKPAQVSPHIAVRAPWVELEVPAGVETIVIEPGMAFGTGLHETTQLCIKAIDKYTTQNQIQSMLDVGCGSGVLSIAASKCGVPTVRGVDNDPVCIDVSNENGAYNKVNATFDGTDIWDITEKYDLVVANIISSVLMALREDLKNAVKPGGHLVLSGILTEEKQDVLDAFLSDSPIQKVAENTMGEWCSLEFEK